MARVATAGLALAACLACADGATWIKQTATGTANCSGAAVQEAYYPQDHCFKAYGGKYQKNTCNSTHMISSIWANSSDCSGAATTITPHTLCKNGAKTVCDVSADMVKVNWFEKAACTGPVYEAQEPLNVCIFKGGSKSEKSTCVDGVFVKSTFNASTDCTGTAGYDYTTQAGMNSSNATHCLGPFGTYKEYLRMSGGCKKEVNLQEEREKREKKSNDTKVGTAASNSLGLRPVLAFFSAPLLLAATSSL